jgi:hypothetical protein
MEIILGLIQRTKYTKKKKFKPMRQALMASHNDGSRTTQVNAITVLKNNQNDVVLIKKIKKS